MTLEALACASGVGLFQAAGPDELAAQLANRVAAALNVTLAERGVASLALSGGRSPEPFLRHLATLPLDWARIRVTLVDERWVPVEHPDSNAGLLRRCLPQALETAQWMPLYQGISPQADAQWLNRHLASWLPLDVVVLGMGSDGHTASLFPGMPKLAQALAVDAPQLCLAIPAQAGRAERLSLSGRALRTAGLQLLAISGDDKRRTLIRALESRDAGLPISAFLAPPLDIYYSPQG
ncbi:6-phosphogluconolactonase [Pseudomonas sp. WN033]|nr:6-phosphogluconolactonase [Pseudomonas sp. WN033]